jgi:hypothetical protein
MFTETTLFALGRFLTHETPVNGFDLISSHVHLRHARREHRDQDRRAPCRSAPSKPFSPA